MPKEVSFSGMAVLTGASILAFLLLFAGAPSFLALIAGVGSLLLAVGTVVQWGVMKLESILALATAALIAGLSLTYAVGGTAPAALYTLFLPLMLGTMFILMALRSGEVRTTFGMKQLA